MIFWKFRILNSWDLSLNCPEWVGLLWHSFVFAAPFAAPADRKRSIVVPKPSSFRPGNIPQRPQKQEDHSQDVEFRGYFYLNGMPRFCIYNVEAQFSEWITLGEATFEEFNASGFDLDSETLTFHLQRLLSISSAKLRRIPEIIDIHWVKEFQSFEKRSAVYTRKLSEFLLTQRLRRLTQSALKKAYLI